MRYTATGLFQEEQRRGFIVTHQMSKTFETALEMSDHVGNWLKDYNSEYCHHLEFSVKETTQ